MLIMTYGTPWDTLGHPGTHREAQGGIGRPESGPESVRWRGRTDYGMCNLCPCHSPCAEGERVSKRVGKIYVIINPSAGARS
jgi:hypothetical protein